MLRHSLVHVTTALDVCSMVAAMVTYLIAHGGSSLVKNIFYCQLDIYDLTKLRVRYTEHISIF